MELTLPLPIYAADPHVGPVPQKYISIKRTQKCACCNRQHSWSEVYAWTEMKSTLGLGKRIENLRALEWPRYRVPIEQWEDTKCHLIPFCHDCNEPSLMNSPDLLDPPVHARLAMMGGSRDEPPAKPAAEPKTPRTKTPLPVDTLMDLLR